MSREQIRNWDVINGLASVEWRKGNKDGNEVTVLVLALRERRRVEWW